MLLVSSSVAGRGSAQVCIEVKRQAAEVQAEWQQGSGASGQEGGISIKMAEVSNPPQCRGRGSRQRHEEMLVFIVVWHKR